MTMWNSPPTFDVLLTAPRRKPLALPGLNRPEVRMAYEKHLRAAHLPEDIAGLFEGNGEASVPSGAPFSTFSFREVAP